MDIRLRRKVSHLHVDVGGLYDAGTAREAIARVREDSAVNRGVPVRTTAVASEAYGFLGVEPPA